MSLRYEYGHYYVSSKVPNDLLPTLKCSRAVSLAGYKNISSLPDCIGNHIHLRYIDLSYTAIERLPDTVSSLYNLQTLLLVGCTSLVELPVDMRKLINLRHLDIGYTGIKEMPVRMGRLKSLRTLTAYVLGTSTRSGGIGELGELPNLGGKFSILNLENVVDAMDVLRANLKDKKDLNQIELAWGREDADDSIKERNVLERLQPSVNLVELAIRCYGGTSFPNWLGDSSFSNIKVMCLCGFSNCWSLPPVGQLPALKELYISNMKCVMGIGAEFYGVNGTSLIQPFRSLEKLVFGDMPEWEEWLRSPGRGQCPDFPRLEELVLENCPKLRGNLPDHLPCLKKLEVLDCGVLHERATRSRWILETESLRQSLQDLRIRGCPGLSSLLETESLSSLSGLDIQILSRTDCLQPHLSSRLQKLTLRDCGSLLSFPRNGLPTTLTFLEIINCRRLEFLSHEMMAKLTSLQHLDLTGSCDSLRSFPLGVFPKLSSLQFYGIENLESLSIGEGADVENLTHLGALCIYSCPNLVSFHWRRLPTPNLASFTVGNCKNLKLLPDRIHTLTALRDLWISDGPNVESFAEGGLPPNLQSFGISGCEKLRPSVEYWGLQRLVSLRTFTIWRSEDVLVAVLEEQLLPTTLHTLQISGMKSLKSLEGKGIQHLTSLQELQIYECDSLKFLPKEGLPESLRCLRIWHSSSLEKRCQEKTGEEWSKIAHIPCIEIGDQVII
nr:putative disease resistance protein At3g14460 [Malus domestica]